MSTTACGFSEAALRDHAEVYMDFNRKTCLKLRESTNRVAFLILHMQHGLILEVMNPTSFHNMYKKHETAVVSKSAAIYAEYSRYIGSTKTVLRILNRLTPITKEEMIMATKRKEERTRLASAPVKKTADGKPVPPKKKEVSAAARFQELIMQGTMTDDKIFEAVQKEFGLPASKRGYVGWYRNYLKKNGKNPPAAKVAKTTTK